MGNRIYRNLVFLPPDPATYTETVPRKTVYLPTAGGHRIPAYFMRSRHRTKTTILYSHGNAADIGAMTDFLALLHENLPVNILHYEYIGYGLARSEGAPTEQLCYESVEAGLDFLVNTQGIDFGDIIAFGTSLGSGPTTHLVTKYRRIKGLILEAPIASCIKVVMDNALGSFLRPFDMFSNIRKIHRVKCPVLMFHGDSDTVVPFTHGVSLWERVPENLKYKNVWIRGADHHDMIEVLSPRIYVAYIEEFLRHCDEFGMGQERVEELREIEMVEGRRRPGRFVVKREGVVCRILEDPSDEEEGRDSDDVRDDDGYYDIYKML